MKSLPAKLEMEIAQAACAGSIKTFRLSQESPEDATTLLGFLCLGSEIERHWDKILSLPVGGTFALPALNDVITRVS